VVNHGSIVNDASVADMRSGLLGRKRIEVGLADPGGGGALATTLAAAFGEDVEVLERSASVVSIDVDTTRRPIREVLDHLLDAVPVADLSVVDPPLEQVIGEIYERPQ
jgi:ABC-2 type transport system ATP-binding protein